MPHILKYLISFHFDIRRWGRPTRHSFVRITKCFLKDDIHSVLRISSAHNKGGPPDINIAQILHLSNFFELKRTVYIHLQAWRTRKMLDIQLVYHILQI